MNENINLIEILKDCPEGTELYSIVHGYVKFHHISMCNQEYPIRVYIADHDYITGFTEEGKIFYGMPGECILFPSKEQRDWSRFKANKPKFDPSTLKPFDKVIVCDGETDVWRASLFSYITSLNKIATVGITWKIAIPYNEETKYLVGTKDEAPEFYRYWEE